MKEKSVRINAFLNIVRQGCNIIIPLITYPYVSRTLGAANYGKFSFSDTFICILMIIASLGIPTYAIREGARIRDNKEKISKFASEIYSINLISLLGTFILMLVLIQLVPRFQRNVLLTYILSINIFTSVIGRDWINSIYEDFFYLTIRYIFFQVLATVLIFILVHKPEDYIKYTWIMLLSNSGGYACNFFYTRRYIPLRITWKLNLRKHFKNILYLFGVTLAILVYVRSDIAILGFYRSDVEVGIYTLSSKVYSIIKTMLNAVVVVATPRLANYLGEKNELAYSDLLSKVRKALYVIVLPCITGLFFESRNVMQLIGSNQFVEGYVALRILCVALLFAVFGSYYSQSILVPKRKDRPYFYATVCACVVNIVLNILVIPKYGMNGAALTTVVAEFMVLVVCMKYSWEERKTLRSSQLSSILVGCIGISAVCILMHSFHLHYIIELTLSIVCSFIVYALLLLITSNELAVDMYDKFKGYVRKFGV